MQKSVVLYRVISLSISINLFHCRQIVFLRKSLFHFLILFLSLSLSYPQRTLDDVWQKVKREHIDTSSFYECFWVAHLYIFANTHSKHTNIKCEMPFESSIEEIELNFRCELKCEKEFSSFYAYSFVCMCSGAELTSLPFFQIFIKVFWKKWWIFIIDLLQF